MDFNNNNLMARKMLQVAGAIFLLLAVIYNEFLLGSFISDLDILHSTVIRIRQIQVVFLSCGLSFFLYAEFVQRIQWLRNALRKDTPTNILLSILVVGLPIIILELSLDPFAPPRGKVTSIFIKDDVLGWKLRPDANDYWAKVPIRINHKGLRGPELPYTKQSHVRRILYLGDSVTFGFGLEDEQTFPFLVEQHLNRKKTAAVETVNAGVDGYSPWQEYIYLMKEGLNYQPDLVVVSFVLNDVTEKLSLLRFGGWSVGWQLSHTKETWTTLLDELALKSNILYFIKMIGAKMRFGGDVKLGAQRKQQLYVENLVYTPERPEVQEAWASTLEDVKNIAAACKQRRIRVALIVFPFKFQLLNVDSLSAPQRVVGDFAIRNNIACLDVLPLFHARMLATNTKPEDYFLDGFHPSALGNSVVADTLTLFIKSNDLLSRN